jgi:3-(3-hydroxy-phenyl)propionate hydroxylase
MQRTTTDTDVLIVGAGPVGLFLANECARRSLRFRIVERQAGQSEHSKAVAIMPRTLEIFDMAGLVEPFADAVNRVTSVALVGNQRKLGHFAFAPAQSPYPFVGMIPQNVTEKLLLDALTRKSGTVEYATSVVSAVQDDCGVDVTLERAGERSAVRASFVVGCDGAHSTIRHLLDLPFEGAEYRATYVLADIETNETLPADEIQLCTHADGPLAIFPMSGTRRRVVTTAENTGEGAPPLDLVRSLLAQRGPEEIEARSLNWSSYFSIHHRQAAQLRTGRIFVAGDAAHIHSPFGAKGMNTGLENVWNLAWKLDLAIRGRATEALLASYNAERRPVIRHVIEVTDFITKTMGTPGNFAQSIRDVMIPVVSKLAPFQTGFVQTLSELAVAYHGSPIVEWAGERCFDESFRGGRGIGGRFVLFVGADADSVTTAQAQHVAEDFQAVLELRTGRQQGFTLVRPDSYTAYESQAGPAPRVRWFI